MNFLLKLQSNKKFLLGLFFILILTFLVLKIQIETKRQIINPVKTKSSYWLLLKRISNLEYLYFGQPGLKKESRLIKIFKVKTGKINKSPTPLPQLFGRKYWQIIAKAEAPDNPETAPYFLTLDIPVSDEEPYGPSPYLECQGQCNWVLPGNFGLHGINGEESRLSVEDPGSSGCIRHRDEDITYLYQTLDPKKYEIRYYIENIWMQQTRE